MWNELKRWIRALDEQGRARFTGLVSDRERSAAMVANTGIGAASGFALLSSLYFALYLILAIIFLRDELGNPQLWLQLYYFSLLFGLVQGGGIGGMVGRSVSLLWQGRRHKAGVTCTRIGRRVSALLPCLILFSYRMYYDVIDMPLDDPHLLGACSLFSPGVSSPPSSSSGVGISPLLT